MENTYFLVVTDGGPYKSMFEFMQRDITTKFNGGFVCDKVNRTKAKTILLGDRAKKYSMGMLDFLTYEENNLYKAIESASASFKNIVVIFNNSSLFFNKYFPYTLKKYKRKFKNLKYVLLYTDIVASVVSSDAKYLMDKNIFDLVYSIDDNDVKKYRLLGLLLFVGIPLPGTGAWTGALIADLLDIRIKHSLPVIAAGVFMAGVIISIFSYGLLGLIGF